MMDDIARAQLKLQQLRSQLEKQFQLLDHFGEKPDVLKKIAELEAEIATLPQDILDSEKREKSLSTLQITIESYIYDRCIMLLDDIEDMWEWVQSLSHQDTSQLTKSEIKICDLIRELQAIKVSDDDIQIVFMLAQDLESIPLIRCKTDLQREVKQYIKENPTVNLAMLPDDIRQWNTTIEILNDIQSRIVGRYRLLIKKAYPQDRIEETIMTA